ncbi:LHFPL tetraspan subfamily member 2 protein-like [Littorina saxatilis]|uniref:LHFPL tetraspan subfamily member 2 protein-like n=1 Tax=Littorina saxatilis TaxID=31220 RepID=UPI0038B41AFC
MKRLLTWVKTFLQGARARLLWSRRCARCQFSFVPISESSNNDVSSSRSFLVSENVDDCVSSDVTVEDCCHEHHGEGQCCHERDVAECCCDHVEGEDFHEENRKELRHGRVNGGGEEERDRLVSDEGEEDEEEGVEESSRKGSRTRRKLDSVLRTCRRRMSRVTAVSLLWSLLSLLVAGACAFSFYHPNWITHPDRLHSFGLFTQCVRDPQSPHPRAVCVGYGTEGRVDLGSIPAGAWQASTLLFGAGAGLQCVGAVVTFMLLLQPAHPYGGGGHRVALLCGYMQTLAVLLLVSGLVMFPLGFSTSFFSYYCDSSGAFCVGHCRMGWSYVLAITATALAIFCPVLSNYTDVTFDKDGREEREAERDLVTDV